MRDLFNPLHNPRCADGRMRQRPNVKLRTTGRDVSRYSPAGGKSDWLIPRRLVRSAQRLMDLEGSAVVLMFVPVVAALACANARGCLVPPAVGARIDLSVSR